MNKIFLIFADFLRNLVRPAPAYHDDSLRANQGQESGSQFSFWRALVS